MNNHKKDVKRFYNNLKLPSSINLSEGTIDKYQIKMQNSYLDEQGEIVKWQRLSTNYERVVSEQITPFCVLTNLEVKKAEFESSERKRMNWSFAAGHKIPYFLLSANSQEEVKRIEQPDVHEKIAIQVKDFHQSFERFPKLPSVYLYIMQLYDMIAFENFATYFSFIKLEQSMIGEFVEIETLSEAKANLGLGLYSEESTFYNGKFEAAYLGVTVYKNQECVIYSYRCDKSQVKMEDTQINEVREGNSYYSGILFLCLDTFIPVYGTMIENYVAKQKKQNVNVRRQISMELIQDV